MAKRRGARHLGPDSGVLRHHPGRHDASLRHLLAVAAALDEALQTLDPSAPPRDRAGAATNLLERGSIELGETMQRAT